jgi:hypothetical protein
VSEEQAIVETILAAGYREFPGSPVVLSNADRFFQRRVEVGEATRYFLNLGLYDCHRHTKGAGERFACQLEVALFHPEWGKSSIDLTFGVAATSAGIKAAEAMVALIYQRAGMEPDRHNQRGD